MYKTQDEKQDWNLNQAGSSIVGMLIDKANQAALEGDIITWFNSLRVLWNNIKGHKKVKELENKTIQSHFDEAMKLMPEKSKVSIQELKRYDLEQLKKTLDELHGDIMGQLHDSGLWFTVFEKDSRLPIYK